MKSQKEFILSSALDFYKQGKNVLDFGAWLCENLDKLAEVKPSCKNACVKKLDKKLSKEEVEELEGLLTEARELDDLTENILNKNKELKENLDKADEIANLAKEMEKQFYNPINDVMKKLKSDRNFNETLKKSHPYLYNELIEEIKSSLSDKNLILVKRLEETYDEEDEAIQDQKILEEELSKSIGRDKFTTTNELNSFIEGLSEKLRAVKIEGKAEKITQKDSSVDLPEDREQFVKALDEVVKDIPKTSPESPHDSIFESYISCIMKDSIYEIDRRMKNIQSEFNLQPTSSKLKKFREVKDILQNTLNKFKTQSSQASLDSSEEALLEEVSINIDKDGKLIIKLNNKDLSYQDLISNSKSELDEAKNDKSYLKSIISELNDIMREFQLGLNLNTEQLQSFHRVNNILQVLLNAED